MAIEDVTILAPTPPSDMTAQEKRHLGALERRIAAGLQTFREVGAALLEIRDSRLYRESHATFEAYCGERWGMNRARAYQLIDSARVVQALGAPSELTNEAQARELAPLATEDAQRVWAQVRATAEETKLPVTASLIRSVRERVVGGNGNGHPAAAEPSVTDRLVQDMVRLGNAYTRWQESEPTPTEKRKVTAAKKALVSTIA